jgi:hypothetical protein
MTDEERDLRWVLEVIGQQQDGAWGNFARMALDGTMKIAETRERWTKPTASTPAACCWLDQKGCIVLGDIAADERVVVSLAADEKGDRWLAEIPEAARTTVFREVTTEMAMAGSRIKQLLLLARKSVRLTGQTNG